jgi:SET domain-containing protein
MKAISEKKNFRLMDYFEIPRNFHSEGRAICLFISLLNHSCDPNVNTIMVNNKEVVYTVKPIKKGEQLFMCYG